VVAPSRHFWGPEGEKRPLPEPVGIPVMRQTWNHTTFVHWPCSPDALRPLFPQPLEIDLFEDRAWLSLVLFQAERTRLPGLPPVPFLSTFTEINLRTYVTVPGDRPALWFHSLEASHLPTVVAARVLSGVPYQPALTSTTVDGGTFRYRSRRLVQRRVGLDGRVRRREPCPPEELGQLDHFLTARWGAYGLVAGRLRYTPVEHPLWPLHRCELLALDETITAACGVPGPEEEVIVQYAPAIEATLGLSRKVGRR
jgi:uncharacterized protein YqjF (DUF2071 family)